MINKFVPHTRADLSAENSVSCYPAPKIIVNSYFQIKLMLKNKLKKGKKGVRKKTAEAERPGDPLLFLRGELEWQELSFDPSGRNQNTEVLVAPTASRQTEDETSTVRPLEKNTAPARAQATGSRRSHSDATVTTCIIPVLHFLGITIQIFTLEGKRLLSDGSVSTKTSLLLYKNRH